LPWMVVPLASEKLIFSLKLASCAGKLRALQTPGLAIGVADNVGNQSRL
jgi:hypothetical protein